MAGKGDKAVELFDMLNPISKSNSPAKIKQYRVEPYCIAADIYSQPPHTGVGGWTWYTGSAAWMYRLGVEDILGIHKRGNDLIIDPCISRAWKGYDLKYRFEKTLYQIHVDNSDGVERGVKSISLDGIQLPGYTISLMKDGGKHEVQVRMGKDSH